MTTTPVTVTCRDCGSPIQPLETYCKICMGKPVYNIVECDGCGRPRIEGQPKRCMCDVLR